MRGTYGCYALHGGCRLRDAPGTVGTVPAGAVCWVVGSGCRMPQGSYLWVLGAGQLPIGKPGPTGLLCPGESSDLPRRQRNAQFTAKETEKQPRSLSQQGKMPGLEMGPAPTSQPPGSPGDLEPSCSPPGSQPLLPFCQRGSWERGCWNF